MAARQGTLLLIRGANSGRKAIYTAVTATPSSSSTSRGLSTSRLVSFPRQIRPRFNLQEEAADSPTSAAGPSASAPSSSSSSSSSSLSSSSPSSSSASSGLPWFLQDQAEEVVVVKPAATAKSRGIEELPRSTSGSALPDTLLDLDELLATGPSSPLIRRRHRSKEDEEEDDDTAAAEAKRPTIVYIDAKAHDADAWADWIVVVEVQARSGITRVAKDIGQFLKRAPVPTSSLASPSSSSSVSSAARSPSTSSSSSTNDKSQPWRPRKILSREAQEGLRLLHAHDPQTYSRQALAAQFKISVEAVRRILKSKFQPGGDVVSRQNRRAKEREEEWKKGLVEGQGSWKKTEAEELERIKQSIVAARGADSSRVSQAEEEEEQDPDEVAWSLEGEEDGAGKRRGKNTVRYEGLDDEQSSSRARRGGGDWCLIDAEWCVVHVMTPEARSTYDVESIWEKKSTATASANAAATAGAFDEQGSEVQSKTRRVRAGEVPL